jgi:hypothetical protein
MNKYIRYSNNYDDLIIFSKFMEMYQNQARQRGIELGNPARKEVIQMSRHQVRNTAWSRNLIDFI